MCATNTGVVFVDDCKSIGNGHAGCTGEQVGEPVTNDPTAYWGLHEPSGFAVLEVITWNRALSTGEINNALGYLNYVVDQSSSGCTNTAPATTTTTTAAAAPAPAPSGTEDGFDVDILHVRMNVQHAAR